MVIGIRIKISADELRAQLRKLAGLCRQAADEYRGQIDQVRRAEEAVKDAFSQMAPAFRVVVQGPRPSNVLLADAEHCETLARGYEFKAARVADGDHELPDFVLEMMGFFDQDDPAPRTNSPRAPRTSRSSRRSRTRRPRRPNPRRRPRPSWFQLKPTEARQAPVTPIREYGKQDTPSIGSKTLDSRQIVP
jgi:hypothetical protein